MTRLPALLALPIALPLLGPVAGAQNIGMPAGATQWIELAGGWAAAGTCCDDAAGAVGALPYPSPNYVGDPAYLSLGLFVYANADSDAQRLRNSYVSFRATNAFLSNSLVDTYTVSGPPGTAGNPLAARVVFRAVGTLTIPFTNSLGQYAGGSSAEIEVGYWNPSTDPALPQAFRVAPFAPTFAQTASLPTANYGAQRPELPIDIVVDEVLNIVVGTPFDVAFALNTNGMGAGNLSGTTAPGPGEYIVATIDWILPSGYTLSSNLGWTPPSSGTVYCTAGTTSNGCSASMSANGVPSVAASSGFTLSVAGVEGQRQGLIFYGTNGRASSVWAQGSTSLLCVKTPVQRTATHGSGGTNGACDGALSLDLLGYLSTHPNALGQPLSAGTVLQAQAWFRDPPAPGNTNLSNGIEFTLVP